MIMRAMFSRRGGLAAIVLSGLLAALPARAAEKPATPGVIEYRVKLASLEVARATIKAERDGDIYRLFSRFKSSGIANVIADMVAETDATGQIGAKAFRPGVYGQQFKRGDKGRRYDIRFDDGRVADYVVQPPRKSLPEGWVAISPDDLAGASDPLSAVFRPAETSPCGDRLAVFDGEMRFDLAFSPKASEPVDMIGHKGVAEVCKVAFRPVSGYRKGREDIDWLKGQGGIEVGFVRSPAMEAWVPVTVRVPTRLGPLLIEAVRFGL